MSWKNVVLGQLLNASQTMGKLSTTDLAEGLVERGIIPETVKDDQTLHGILLSEIVLNAIAGVKVPPAPQNQDGYFVYRMNAKEMLVSEMVRRNSEQVRGLERRTGINLEHYYKISKRKECSMDACSTVAGQGLSKRKRVHRE